VSFLPLLDPLFMIGNAHCTFSRIPIVSPDKSIRSSRTSSKGLFHRKRLEQAFYNEYFNAADWYRNLDKNMSAAEIDAGRFRTIGSGGPSLCRCTTGWRG